MNLSFVGAICNFTSFSFYRAEKQEINRNELILIPAFRIFRVFRSNNIFLVNGLSSLANGQWSLIPIRLFVIFVFFVAKIFSWSMTSVLPVDSIYLTDPFFVP